MGGFSTQSEIWTGGFAKIVNYFRGEWYVIGRRAGGEGGGGMLASALDVQFFFFFIKEN